MWTNPFKRLKPTEESSSSKSDSDPKKNEDTTNPFSIPSNMPAVVRAKIKSQNNVIPVQYYNCTLHPHFDLKAAGQLGDFPSHVLGRWTYNNLPEFGVTPFNYEPMLKIVPDPPPAKQTPKIPVVTTESCCCHLQSLLPCVCCALRMQDGDYRALCRRDPEIKNTETCIECAYSRRTCTLGGFKASEEGTALVQARECARKSVDGGKDDVLSRVALNAMQSAAAEYLAAIWSQGSVYDLIAVQCLYNSSRIGGPTSSKMTKKKTRKPKGNDGKRIQKQKRTGKDVGMSQFLNQGNGLAIARNVMIREMLTYNRKISETLQNNESSETLQINKEILNTLRKNNEILKQLLCSAVERNKGHGPTNSQG